MTLQARLEAAALAVTALTEDGRKVSVAVPTPFEAARDADRMLETVRAQLSKRSGSYAFSVAEIEADGPVPFMSASFLNGIRRDLAAALDAQPVRMLPLRRGATRPDPAPEALTYQDNIANSIAREIYRERGSFTIEDAFELTHREGVEYMRTKYCLRHELGLCPKLRPGTRPEPLYLRNQGRRLRLDFDCAACEMVVR